MHTERRPNSKDLDPPEDGNASEPVPLDVTMVDGDDDAEVDTLVNAAEEQAEKHPVLVSNRPWRAITVRIHDDIYISFEARPDDDTTEMLHEATYLCMAMVGFRNDIETKTIDEVALKWLGLKPEVDGG